VIIAVGVIGLAFNLIYENVSWFENTYDVVLNFLNSVWSFIWTKSGLQSIFDYVFQTPFVVFILPILMGLGVFGHPIWNAISNQDNLIKAGSTAQKLMKKFGTLKTFQDKLGVQAEIDREIETLLKLWILETDGKSNKKAKGKLTKILLFIDDLDRCNEEGLIELIDSLRIMLDQEEIRKRVQVVVAVDEEILELSINLKYSKFTDYENKENPNEKNKRNFALDYFDKLFLLGVRLSELTLEDMQKYHKELTKDDKKENTKTTEETRADENLHLQIMKTSKLIDENSI
jgi:hypothetical protein